MQFSIVSKFYSLSYAYCFNCHFSLPSWFLGTFLVTIPNIHEFVHYGFSSLCSSEGNWLVLNLGTLDHCSTRFAIDFLVEVIRFYINWLALEFTRFFSLDFDIWRWKNKHLRSSIMHWIFLEYYDRMYPLCLRKYFLTFLEINVQYLSQNYCFSQTFSIQRFSFDPREPMLLI